MTHCTSSCRRRLSTSTQPSQMARGALGPRPWGGGATPNPLLPPRLGRTWGSLPTQASRAEVSAEPRRERLFQFQSNWGHFMDFTCPRSYWKRKSGPSGGPLPGSRRLDLHSWELLERNHGAPGPGTKAAVLSFLTHPRRSSSSLVLLVPPVISKGGVCVLESRVRHTWCGILLCAVLWWP